MVAYQVAILLVILGAIPNARASECVQLDLVRGHLKFVDPEHAKDKAVLVNIDKNLQAYAGLTEEHTILLNWIDTQKDKLVTTGEITSAGDLSMQTIDPDSTECLAKAKLRFFRADKNLWALTDGQTIISLWQGPFPANWLGDMPITKKP